MAVIDFGASPEQVEAQINTFPGSQIPPVSIGLFCCVEEVGQAYAEVVETRPQNEVAFVASDADELAQGIDERPDVDVVLTVAIPGQDLSTVVEQVQDADCSPFMVLEDVPVVAGEECSVAQQQPEIAQQFDSTLQPYGIDPVYDAREAVAKAHTEFAARQARTQYHYDVPFQKWLSE